MSTSESSDARYADVQPRFYLPATPSTTGEPGRLQRFVEGLDKGPRP